MTDTKHEMPEIDWSKPVEVFHGGDWREITHSVRNNDGSLYVDDDGDVRVWGLNFNVWADHHNIRNKPEPLEVWLNVYPEGPALGVYKSKDAADKGASENRIRRARMVEAPDQ